MKSKYSDLRNSKRVDLSKAVPLMAPFTVFIDPTNICNFKCNCCPQSRADFAQQSGGLFSLSKDDFDLIAYNLKQLGKVKTLHIHLTGEPLVNKNTIYMIKKCKDSNLADKIILTTNASLMFPEVSRELIQAGVDYVRISIYGTDEKTHCTNTNSRVNFATITENVRQLKLLRDAYNTSTFIACKMIDFHCNSEKSFKDIFSDISDECFVQKGHNWNNKDRLARAAFEERLGVMKADSICPYPFYTMVIHANLDVSPCGCDYSHSLTIGNLKKESLSEIWKGEKLVTLQTALIMKQFSDYSVCQKCNFYMMAGDNIDNLQLADFLARRQKLYAE